MLDTESQYFLSNVFNYQLYLWCTATAKFDEINSHNIRKEYCLFIVNNISVSLEVFAGANGAKGNDLLTRYHYFLNVDLAKDNSVLWNHLESLNQFYNQFSKHLIYDEMLKDLIKNLITYDNIRHLIGVAANIWKWGLEKKYNGTIPPHFNGLVDGYLSWMKPNVLTIPSKKVMNASKSKQP